MENRENCTKHPCSGLELVHVSFCPSFTGQNFEQDSSWIQGVSENAPLAGQLVLSHPVHYGSGAQVAASFTWPAFSEHLAITRPNAEYLGHTTGGDTALSINCLPCLREVHRECLSWAKEAKDSQKHENNGGQGEVNLGCHFWAAKMSTCFYFCNIFSNHQIVLNQLKMIPIIATTSSAL